MPTDEELELEREEEKKRPAQPLLGGAIHGPGVPQSGEQVRRVLGSIGTPIGVPIVPEQSSVSATNILPGADTRGVPPAMAPPDVGSPAAPPATTPTAPTSIGEPIAPRTPRPQYHGLNRVLDTIAGATRIGSAIEGAGGLGTEGWRVKNADEERQIEQAERERQANVLAEEEAQKTETERAGSELVDVTLPDGSHQQVMRKNLASPTAAIITGASRENVAATNQQGATEREGSKEKTQKEIAAEREASAEKIARERIASAERIATGHNLAQTEIARIRAAAANDPNKLTNTMKTMKQQAQGTLPGIERALDETEKVAGLLGPGEGRWNDFMTGKIGGGDPAYKHYKDEIAMVSSAVTLAHARGRMSNELFDHFNQMFDAGKLSAENMIQALNVAHEWLSEYANMGEPGSPVGNATPSGGGAPIELERGSDGKLRPKAAAKK